LRPIVVAWVMTVAVQAHELAVLPRAVGESVIVTANYGGTAPAAFCQVAVFSPAKAGAEFQTGRTDARGRFAFLPDVGGKWRVIVDDEMGHRQEATIDWNAAGGPAAEATAQPAWQKALTGASLLLGLTGMWLWWRVRGKV